jgi:hypothetical protein
MGEHAGLSDRYARLRRVGLELNTRLTEALPHHAFNQGGKKLGLLKRNVLTLDSEDEIAVLADFCIHDVRGPRGNTVERYLADFPPPVGSDELILLQALRQARYALIVVERKEFGVGAYVRDLLRDEAFFLTDMGLGSTAPVGMVLAARIMTADGITMTTGAALPAAVFSPAERDQLLQRLKAAVHGKDFRDLTPAEAGDLAATLIRTCLQQGAAERIAYIEPAPLDRTGHEPSALPPARRVGRNDPCPCGSGRKFKHCCGRK